MFDVEVEGRGMVERKNRSQGEQSLNLKVRPSDAASR